MKTDSLDWPLELADSSVSPDKRWLQAGSNICLDFHGDPVKAQLVVFSDGNHHMALLETLSRFCELTDGVEDIFYATTPPGVLVDVVSQGNITIGNLTLSRQPHVFISPRPILDKLINADFANAHQPYMQSCGNVMLVRNDNPKGIHDLRDLLREDVRLFLSNPNTEKASYDVYRASLLAIAKDFNAEGAMHDYLSPDNTEILYGERIHHREAPQCVFDGSADVAIVYYHLALRYTRIFPGEFEIITLGGGNNLPPNEAGNEQTQYFISEMKDTGAFGKDFIEFCQSDEVSKIYISHGLKRPE